MTDAQKADVTKMFLDDLVSATVTSDVEIAKLDPQTNIEDEATIAVGDPDYAEPLIGA